MELKAYSQMLTKLRSVESRMTRSFEEKTGFSLTRYEILTYLRDHGASAQADIADHLDIDPAAVTRHLKILEEKNYVNRKRNRENAREVIVSLTEYARSELEKCRERHCEETCELTVPFSKEEIDRLMHILCRIEEKLP